MTAPPSQAELDRRRKRVDTLVSRRYRLGVSAKRLAAITNLGTTYLNNIERMHGHYSDRVIDRYEQALRNYVAMVRLLADEWGY